MNRPALAILAAVIIALAACRVSRPAVSCRPEQYGLEEWTLHPEALDKAVTLADGILSGDGTFRLLTPRVTAGGGQPISVFQVHGSFVSDADVAMVAEDRCVFVNHDWKKQLAPFFGGDTQGAMDLEPADALAIILLHEVGHIPKQALPQDAAISTLLASLGEAKREEMRADAFAARQLAKAFNRKWDSGMASFHLSLALTNITWNLQANREINHFGATTLHSRDVFSETGDSHPNLELRFLVINYLVHPMPAALDLLNDFLDARSHPGGVLYQNNPSSPYSLLPDKHP
jgi:hypothetical protein